jgi:hypothetical protein
METTASPGVDGVDDREASTCSSSKKFKACGEVDMMSDDTAEFTGVIVSDGLRMRDKPYIYMREVKGIEAMTSSHAGVLSQAAAPL